jgi:hypothetical protein
LEGSRIFDDSKAAIGSARLASGADIGYSSRFLLLSQHFHAGVNEWLTIRNSSREFFKWLLISRYRAHSGSGGIATRPAVDEGHKRQYRGGGGF